MEEIDYHKSEWHRCEAGDGKTALRSTSGIICVMWKPSHFSGQHERFERETQEMEAVFQLFRMARETKAAMETAHTSLRNIAALTKDAASKGEYIPVMIQAECRKALGGA